MNTSPLLTQKLKRRKVSLKKLNWKVVFGISVVHIMAIFAFIPVLFSWSGLVIAITLLWVSGGFGITLCYHRLLTHASYKTPRWFRYLLTTLGTIAWQGGPITWVGNHRLHHKHSDTKDDPHTPRQGFDWAHMFWVMFDNPELADPRDAAKDLQRDAGIKFIDRFFWAPQIILTILLFVIGYLLGGVWLGAGWVVRGIGIRTTAVYHLTWLINSGAHTWGYRNFQTNDNSRNLWWMPPLLSWGENWHNNHHAQQRSAAHGMRWYEFDPTYWTIKLLALFGLAHDIVEPDKSSLK